MSSEEEFKKALNSILESKEFPFEEKEWENARKIIDERRGGKRLFYFILSALLVLLTGVFTYLNFILPGDNVISSVPHTNNTAPQQKIIVAEKPSSETCATLPAPLAEA